MPPQEEIRVSTKAGRVQNSFITVMNRIDDDYEDEWVTPLDKISALADDDDSWQYAHEILEPPSPLCRKVGDEARSIAARHIIDRILEKNLLTGMLDKTDNVAPRLRSAVELLSKPDADFVFPPFQFVVNQTRNKYPEVYSSVVNNINIRIPQDMKPSTVLVSLAKSTLVNQGTGQIEMNWGKFVALLGLSGALAIDVVEAGFPEEVSEIVDTFGILVEQIMGEWILSDKPGEGGGWEGFIKMNVYKPMLPPVPRTIVILSILAFLLYLLSKLVLFVFYICVDFYISVFPHVGDHYSLRWWSVYPHGYCLADTSQFKPFWESTALCIQPKSILEMMYLDNSFL